MSFFDYHRRRRPVWQPTFRSRLASFLKNQLVHLRRKRRPIIIVGIIAAATAYLYLHRRDVIIDTFVIPKEWADQGLTGDVIARQIKDELDRMEIAGHNSLQKDNFVVHADPDPIPDIRVRGIGVRALLDDARAVLNMHISGDFMIAATAPSGPPMGPLVGTLRIRRNRRSEAPIFLTAVPDKPQSMSTLVAEALLRRINPLALGYFLYKQGAATAAGEVWEELARDPKPQHSPTCRSPSRMRIPTGPAR